MGMLVLVAEIFSYNINYVYLPGSQMSTLRHIRYQKISIITKGDSQTEANSRYRDVKGSPVIHACAENANNCQSRHTDILDMIDSF